MGGTMIMTLQRIIELPDAADSDFDHGAFDDKSRKVFVAHTARGRVEVIDHDASRHVATLDGFPEAAGVVAANGDVLVTSRGCAELVWLDAVTMERRGVFKTGPRPNGVAIVPGAKLAIAAAIGDETAGPRLHVFDLTARREWSAALPGRPRWCVTDAAGKRVFLAIREPSMVWVADLPELANPRHWLLPAAGAHGMDIDQAGHKLYVACDDATLVAVHTDDGRIGERWPPPGAPDATFFNPASGQVHVAIEAPGLIQSIDPRTGARSQAPTGPGTKTTALISPEHLYAFSPKHRGALVLTSA
jgi:DNA-binding beta-propeller fold protein YncE